MINDWYAADPTAEAGAALAKAGQDLAKVPRSMNFDPMDFRSGIAQAAMVSSTQHPGTIGMDYQTLMAVARIGVVGAIHQCRINEVADFCTPQANEYAVGYGISLRDKNMKANKASGKRSDEIMRVIERAGGKYGIGGFEPTIRALMRDSLTYDQANMEIVRTRLGKVHGFVPVDAATIRRAHYTDKERKRGLRNPDKVKCFAQIMNDRIANTYEHHEMLWGIRRPRTWIAVTGYGYPELEELTQTITDLLNATTWNSVNFTNGIHTNTVLALKSTMTEDAFNAFKRQITALMHGVSNRGRVPLLQLDPDHKEDLTAVNVGGAANDMEFGTWINWLLKLCCAVYSMDPAELGFVFGNEGQTSSLNQQSPEDRIKASKERGLRPLLRSLQSWLNTWVVHALDEDFTIEFSGLDNMTEAERIKMDSEAVKSSRTLNEVRAAHDLPSLDTELADLVMDPSFINAWMQLKQSEEMGQGGEMGEEPDAFDDSAGFDYSSLSLDPNDIDGSTQSMADSAEKAVASGMFDLRKSGHRKAAGERRRYAFSPGRTPGSRTVIVEVD